MKKNIIYISIICAISLILFYRPLFSTEPLGLDTLGHLSKVSYLKIYPLADWDMSWYSGTLFLKLYSPLFYYLAALFPNPIVAANCLSFLSIVLTSLGIYFIIRYKTENEKMAALCGVAYLTTLSISYYWISTGNLPYFFALWTLPFSLLFLEKSMAEKRKKDFVLYSLFFAIGILTHIVVGFLTGLFMIIRFLFNYSLAKSIKRMLLYGIITILMASFWFIPFLFYSSPGEKYAGYVPEITQLFGFGDKIAWGLHAGGIGILAVIFIISLFFFNKYYKNKTIISYLVFILLLGFLYLGGLGSHYPLGVDPVRFVLPLSIMLSISLGLIIHKALLNRYLFASLIALLIIGLVCNFFVIDQNFQRFSYYGKDSRYKIIQDIISQKDFPLSNEFTNYRFGTNKYIFGETLTYFMPNIPQTFGYQDAGMLNAPRFYDMKWHIWASDSINDSIYWLNWLGIRYFEVELRENISKFQKDSRFKQIMRYNEEYSFIMFEYLDAKQIISLVNYVNDSAFGKEKEFTWKRENPDRISIEYDFIDESDAVLLKESYHKGWGAREIGSKKELNIEKVGPGFMAVHPPVNSKGIIFYQKRTLEEISGIILTILGAIILIFMPSQAPSPSKLI